MDDRAREGWIIVLLMQTRAVAPINRTDEFAACGECHLPQAHERESRHQTSC
jgi:hypothetical protein